MWDIAKDIPNLRWDIADDIPNLRWDIAKDIPNLRWDIARDIPNPRWDISLVSLNIFYFIIIEKGFGISYTTLLMPSPYKSTA